jgi:hypothetical protein
MKHDAERQGKCAPGIETLKAFVGRGHSILGNVLELKAMGPGMPQRSLAGEPDL